MTTKKEYKVTFMLLSFFFPFFILLMVAALQGMYPFGDQTIMTGDITYQFIDYLSYFKTIFFGNNDLTYTFSKTLGGDMAGFSAYYLFSPFNLLLLLFPDKWLPAGLMFMIFLKCGLCSVSFFYMLTKLFGFHKEGLIFSTTYALMGYVIVYFQLYAYFDNLMLLPFIVWGIHRLLENPKKKSVYIISLSLSIIINYYVGWMLCIFSALYFLFQLAIRMERVREWKEKLPAVAAFAVSSVTAGMMSCFVILPALLSLRGEKNSFHLGFYRTFEMSQLFSRFYTNSFKGNVSGCLPNIYCGVLVILLAGFFFFQKKISKRERVFSGLFLVFFFLNFYINTLNVVWHGFNLPIGFPYRYSFLVTFLLLLFAYKGYLCGKGEYKNALLAGAFLLYTSYSAYLLVRGSDVVGIREIVLDGIILILLLVLLFLYRRKKIAQSVLFLSLFVVQLGDLSINANDAMKYFDFAGLTEYQAYLDETGEIIENIKEQDTDFYRIEKYYRRSHNDSMQFDYSGLTHYSSCEKKEIISFMGKMGFRDNGNWSFYNNGSTSFIDSLFGVKYVISQFDTTGKPYSKAFVHGDKTVFRNPYALPLAFNADKAVRSADCRQDNVFEIQNNLADSISGNSNEIFREAKCEDLHIENMKAEQVQGYTSYTKEDPSKDAYLEYSIIVDNENVLQAYFTAPDLQGAEIFLNGSSMGGYFEKYRWDVMDLGSHEEGERVTVRIVPESDSLKIGNAYFYYEDCEALRDWYQSVSAERCSLQKLSSSHLAGEVNVDENKCIVFSIPYEESWKIYIDGVEEHTQEAAGRLLSVDASPGRHEIELVYQAAGRTLGITISCVSFVFFLYILWIENREKMEQKKYKKMSGK